MMAASKLPPAWPLAELLRECGAKLDPPGAAVSGLSADSRSVRAGDLFFACAEDPRASSAHIEQAIAAGAAAIVTRSDVAVRPGRVPLVRVDDIARCLGAAADRYYDHPSRELTVIGVTGTNGKTSVTHFIAQGLRAADDRVRCGVLGTLGYGFLGALREGGLTTPDVLRVHAELAALRGQGASHVAMEASSHGLAQGRVEGVRFAVAVFTNLSHDHLDYHGDLAAYGRAKARLFESPGLARAVINVDDPFAGELLRRLPRDVEALAYTTRPGARAPQRSSRALSGEVTRTSRRGFAMRVSVDDASATLDVPLLGAFNASNVLAALGALLACGLPLAEAARALTRVSCVPGRMEPFGGAPGEPLVVVDYSHTPDALEKALAALAEQREGALWCVFGCGGDRDRAKRPRMGAIAARLAEHPIITDDNPRSEDGDRIVADALAGLADPGALRVIRDRARAIEHAVCSADPRDTVLVAGKGHERYQEIGGVRRPFSDAAVVRAALARRGK